MTLRTLDIRGKKFVLLARRDFNKLAAQAEEYTEDEYWTKAALKAEAIAKLNGEKAIPFEQVDRELAAHKRPATTSKRRQSK